MWTNQPLTQVHCQCPSGVKKKQLAAFIELIVDNLLCGDLLTILIQVHEPEAQNMFSIFLKKIKIGVFFITILRQTHVLLKM